jgi:hypothetical protein
MAFECRSCGCGGCAARLTYRYEGYAISLEGPSCGCASGNGSGGVSPPPPWPDARIRALASSQEFTLGDLPVTNVVFAGSNSQWTVFETLDGES